MARLAAGYLSLPTAEFAETGVRSMRERLELVLVTVLAGVIADVVLVVGRGDGAVG
jgi:hypothetical protein